ncbi:MAG: hypothetical protein CL930_14670 [Deltaproteobacteria bacterium]|nr:hypothetical protein [Deltaproteobacteria bacterium]
MAKDRVKILSEWSAWAEPVRQGRLIRPDGDAIWVLIRGRPDITCTPEEYQILRRSGRWMARIDHPSVLRLIHINRIGGEPVWVYEGFQGVSLARALDVLVSQGQHFPAKAAVETVHRTIQGVRAGLRQGRDGQGASGNVIHPGPSPSEILVDAVGSIKVAGFAVDSPGAPIMTAPRGYQPVENGTPEQAAAYGLGALLTHLLSGERPGRSADGAERHQAVVRRSIIRVLSRPGEAIPEPLVDVIKGALSFDADERPSLTAMEDALAEIAKTLTSSGVRNWAPTTVPGLLQQQEDGYPDPDTGRMRKHIEPHTDEIALGPPPVRKPRADEGVSPHGPGAAPTDETFRESTPLVSLTSNSGLPTSETDVRLFQAAGDVPAGGGEPAVSLDVGNADDTWDGEEDDAARMGGWPLVMGATIGMVLAAVVGWVVVEHMLEPAGNTEPNVVQTTASEQALPDPVEAETLGSKEELAKEMAESEEEAPPAEDPAKAEYDDPEPDIKPAAKPPAEAPVAKAAPVKPSAAKATKARTSAGPKSMPSAPNPAKAAKAAAPKTSKAAKAAKQPSTPVPESFTVTFRSVDPSIDRIAVKCHKGGNAEGGAVVHISKAGVGPCRVIGYRGSERLDVSVILKKPGVFACFEGGSRTCK